MSKALIPCICLTCGIRNDFSHPNGFCQNGHDDWLEFRDVKERNEFFELGWKLAGSTPEEFEASFMNPQISIIPMVNRPEIIFQFNYLHSQNNMGEGGLISKITVCKWNRIFFYVRENVTGIDSFHISSNERWGDKAGSKPRKSRQTLEVLCPHYWEETIHNIVKLNDPHIRPVRWNRNFTFDWLIQQLKKHDNDKFKYSLSFERFDRQAKQTVGSKKAATNKKEKP